MLNKGVSLSYVRRAEVPCEHVSGDPNFIRKVREGLAEEVPFKLRLGR